MVNSIGRRWLILGLGTILVLIAYRFFTDWRHTTIINLQRTGCFGICPVYDITIFEDGTVAYKGEKFVGEVGNRKADIGKAKVQQLLAEIENEGYFSLQDRYDDEIVPDLPSAVTYVRNGRQEKRVFHYLGDAKAPEKLSKLEEAIDEAANSRQWVDGYVSAPAARPD
jgi:hypothetical protein